MLLVVRVSHAMTAGRLLLLVGVLASLVLRVPTGLYPVVFFRDRVIALLAVNLTGHFPYFNQ
jgi:hypothetical protein